MGAAGTGRFRHGLGLMLALAVFVLAGCGSSVAIIPKGTPTPTPQVTQIAPGVSVPVSALSLPPYTVSTSNPLPTGVSAQKVVADVQVDNLIENAAIVRQDPALLTYADEGAWLTAIETEISQDRAKGIKVLSVTDALTSVQVGYQTDPNNSAADAAVIVVGTEVERDRLANGRIAVQSKHFDVLRWVVWSTTELRFLTCDTGSSPS